MSEKLRCRSLFLSEQSVVDGDLLKNVVLLGPVSTNGTEYSEEAMKSAVPFYRGRAVYLDHDLKAKARRVDERFGEVDADSVRFVEKDYDGRPRVRGNVRFLESHPMSARVVECVNKGLGWLGISHVADGVGRKEGKKRYVEQITSLSSLDLVDRAATGSLVEQEDGEEMPPPVDPAAHAQEGMIKLITAIWLDTTLDKAAKMKKLEALLEMNEPSEPGTPPPPPPEEPPMSEQRLLSKVGELIEQKLTAVLPALVEQGVKDRLAGNKYVRPAGTSDPPPAAPGKSDRVPSDPKERAAWLKKP